jgi:hypothetical protein
MMKHNNKKNQRRIRALERREKDLEELNNKSLYQVHDHIRIKSEIAVLKLWIV